MNRGDVRLRIPFATLLKLALFVLLIACVIKLRAIILMIVVAVLLAVLLDAFVKFLEGHRVRRGLAIAFEAVLLFGLLLAFVIYIVPVTSREAGDLVHNLPQILQRLSSRYPMIGALLRDLLATAGHLPAGPQMRAWLARGLTAGVYAIEALGAVVFVFVIALYLVVEGRTAFAWLVSFAPQAQRRRIHETAEEVSAVVLAFVRGQVINREWFGSRAARSPGMLLGLAPALPAGCLVLAPPAPPDPSLTLRGDRRRGHAGSAQT